jgi:hypothetical protein
VKHDFLVMCPILQPNSVIARRSSGPSFSTTDELKEENQPWTFVSQ